MWIDIVALIVGFLFLSTSALARDVGQREYNAKCASCHGRDGKGQTEMGQKLKVKDLSSAEVQGKLSDDEIRKQMVDGNEAKKMPAFKDKLSPEQMTAVAAYVRTLKK